MGASERQGFTDRVANGLRSGIHASTCVRKELDDIALNISWVSAHKMVGKDQDGHPKRAQVSFAQLTFVSFGQSAEFTFERSGSNGN